MKSLKLATTLILVSLLGACSINHKRDVNEQYSHNPDAGAKATVCEVVKGPDGKADYYLDKQGNPQPLANCHQLSGATNSSDAFFAYRRDTEVAKEQTKQAEAATKLFLIDLSAGQEVDDKTKPSGEKSKAQEAIDNHFKKR